MLNPTASAGGGHTRPESEMHKPSLAGQVTRGGQDSVCLEQGTG